VQIPTARPAERRTRCYSRSSPSAAFAASEAIRNDRAPLRSPRASPAGRGQRVCTSSRRLMLAAHVFPPRVRRSHGDGYWREPRINKRAVSPQRRRIDSSLAYLDTPDCDTRVWAFVQRSQLTRHVRVRLSAARCYRFSLNRTSALRQAFLLSRGAR